MLSRTTCRSSEHSWLNSFLSSLHIERSCFLSLLWSLADCLALRFGGAGSGELVLAAAASHRIDALSQRDACERDVRGFDEGSRCASNNIEEREERSAAY